MQLDVPTLKRDLVELAELARVELEPDELRVEVLPAPHERPSWRSVHQAAYAFSRDGGGQCSS